MYISDNPCLVVVIRLVPYMSAESLQILFLDHCSISHYTPSMFSVKMASGVRGDITASSYAQLDTARQRALNKREFRLALFVAWLCSFPPLLCLLVDFAASLCLIIEIFIDDSARVSGA